MKANLLFRALFAYGAISLIATVHAQDSSPFAHGTYEYRMPADANVTDGVGCGVYIGFQRSIDNVRGSMYARVDRQGETKGVLSLFKGSYDLEVGKGFNHPVELATSTDAKSCTLRVSVAPGEPFKRGLWNMAKVTFTPEEIMRETAKFVYTIELPSAYPADATLANFDRLAAKECYDVGVPESGLFPRNVDHEGQKYCIAVNGRQHVAYVKCMPYRNGSMCKVSAAITTKPQGDVWDLVSVGADFKAAAKAIVEN